VSHFVNCIIKPSPNYLFQFLLGMANLNHLTGAIFGFIVLNGFADNVFSDYLWARAVVLTSPTVATIGMSITIPLAMISDFLINHKVPSGISFLGAFLVVVGFLLVNIPKPLQDDVIEYFQNLFGQKRGRDHIPIGGYSPVDTK
jgi:drug/metabolite transporter (DMT)-like permease